MGMRSFFNRLFGAGPSVNPATGLPMMGGAVDVGGNPYGTDLRREDNMATMSGGAIDHHHDYAGSPTSNDWSSSSWSGVSSSWPDHSSSTSSSFGGYDPSRGW